jgi:hypothetical protein
MDLASSNQLRDVVTQVKIHETRINRIEADIDSEKGTRSRINADIIAEIRVIKNENAKSNKMVHIAMGAWFGVQALLGLGLAVWGLLK